MTDNLDGSFTKLNSSWRENATDDNSSNSSSKSKLDTSHTQLNASLREDTATLAAETEQTSFRPWVLQVDSRPNDYVGGYSPEWIHNYRRQHYENNNKKKIQIAGYNYSPNKKE